MRIIQSTNENELIILIRIKIIIQIREYNSCLGKRAELESSNYSNSFLKRKKT